MPGRIQRSIEAALNPDNERSELSGEAGHRQAVAALPAEGVLNPSNCFTWNLAATRASG